MVYITAAFEMISCAIKICYKTAQKKPRGIHSAYFGFLGLVILFHDTLTTVTHFSLVLLRAMVNCKLSSLVN